MASKNVQNFFSGPQKRSLFFVASLRKLQNNLLRSCGLTVSLILLLTDDSILYSDETISLYTNQSVCFDFRRKYSNKNKLRKRLKGQIWRTCVLNRYTDNVVNRNSYVFFNRTNTDLQWYLSPHHPTDLTICYTNCNIMML